MGATTTNGSFWRKTGGCERYRKWTRGRESSDGTGLEPAAGLRGESRWEAFRERTYLCIRPGKSQTVALRSSPRGTSCEDSCQRLRAQESPRTEDLVRVCLATSSTVAAIPRKRIQ